MRSVLPAVDAAVVVCEADEKKVPQLQLILRELEDQNIPRFLFLNKIDKADKRVRETLELLQPASRVPLLCGRSRSGRRHSSPASSISRSSAPLSTRSTRRPRSSSSRATTLDREKDARFTMLETLADHDDELMEQLLEDIQPPRDKVFDDLAKELRERHGLPGADRRRHAHQRRAAPAEGAAPRGARRRGDRQAARRQGRQRGGRLVLKTFHTAHGGKMSVARVLAARSATAPRSTRPRREAGRVSGVFKLMGQHREARAGAPPARRSRSASSTTPRPATRCRPASRRMPRSSRSSPIRRCWPSRSRPRSARTTSSSAALHQADRGGSLAHRRA